MQINDPFKEIVLSKSKEDVNKEPKVEEVSDAPQEEAKPARRRRART